MKKLVIIGAGGHGKVVADIAEKNGYKEIIFLDDGKSDATFFGYSVGGTSESIDDYDEDFFVAIGNGQIREKILERLSSKNKTIATLIHPNSVIGKGVTLGEGTVVMAGAVINPDTSIGKGVIVNTCASIDHDCKIGDCAHISVGAHVAGTVNIAERTWVGAGATVINNLEICSDCMIGAGATVVKNIVESGTYVGIPAVRIR